ncbi:MAG: hypothetical protein P8Y23_17175, partial [Candidatus Lokiarchaeota archaeon]
GKADLYAKKKGYGKELVKALYNLESFYATGRQIGLNTMLLCDEKITRENQILDYIETAEYIYVSMINPKRISLLSNFLNSHPPSYYRVPAILGDNLNPSKEALLPFICMKKSKIKKYGRKFESARNQFEIIATQKFSQFFNIENIPDFLKNLNRKELYELDLDKNYLFTNKLTNEIIFGTLKEVRFKSNICEIDEFVIIDIKNGRKITLNPAMYDKVRVNLNGIYFFNKKTPLILKNIELNKKYKEAKYIFTTENKKIIKKSIISTNLPISAQILHNFQDNDIFFKDKGNVKILHCNGIKLTKNYEDIEIDLTNIQSEEDQSLLSLKLKNLIIRPRNIYINIRKDRIFRDSERNVINWLIKERCRVNIFLKKPVNNLEIGYINTLKQVLDKKSKNLDIESITMTNIFGKRINIPYKSVEVISFDYKTALVQKKR